MSVAFFTNVNFAISKPRGYSVQSENAFPEKGAGGPRKSSDP